MHSPVLSENHVLLLEECHLGDAIVEGPELVVGQSLLQAGDLSEKAVGLEAFPNTLILNNPLVAMPVKFPEEEVGLRCHGDGLLHIMKQAEHAKTVPVTVASQRRRIIVTCKILAAF